ncbi:MAG: FtsX-like permease family protein [Marinilabiliaceae bacterium]|nr:FtsX-like permease family protein [Marinilabiliaceae bacterium]
MNSRLSLIIARRYLFGKKSQNIINVISMISAIGIMVGTAAMIIVLSVFNGLHSFVGSLFGTFDCDLRVEAIEGKTFEVDSTQIVKLRSIDGVTSVTTILADNALLRFGKRQMPAIVMGVDSAFNSTSSIDSAIVDGEYSIGYSRCILGSILAEQLGTRASVVSQLTIYAPKRTGQVDMAMPERSFVNRVLTIGGLFCINQVEYDSQYCIIDIDIARDIFCFDGNEITAIGIKLAPNADVDNIRSAISTILSAEVRIEDKFEQHAEFFKMMSVEKLMAYLILTFIMIIAALSIVGSLSMLIHDKRDSIYTLKSIGARRSLVTNIFHCEGLLIAIGGAIVGVVLGSAIVWAQQTFGLLSFSNAEAYVISAYPVELQAIDVLISFATVVTIGIVASWFPVRRVVGRYYTEAKI